MANNLHRKLLMIIKINLSTVISFTLGFGSFLVEILDPGAIVSPRPKDFKAAVNFFLFQMPGNN